MPVHGRDEGHRATSGRAPTHRPRATVTNADQRRDEAASARRSSRGARRRVMLEKRARSRRAAAMPWPRDLGADDGVSEEEEHRDREHPRRRELEPGGLPRIAISSPGEHLDDAREPQDAHEPDDGGRVAVRDDARVEAEPTARCAGRDVQPSRKKSA